MRKQKNMILNILLCPIQSYKIYFSPVIIFFLLCSTPASLADENVSDVIILFDQSASMNDYDPKLISKVWLLTFLKTFEKPYNVLLVGFDDKLHIHEKITMQNKTDVEPLREKIKRIETHGLTTDMEAPLRYLLERYDLNPIAFAVIISDGEPEIWDEKRWYLSKKIRSDFRYEGLTKQYLSLKNQGITKKQIYNRLKDRYQAMNLSVINERLAELKEKIGKKLIFLDISGDFKFFKSWAKSANAQYILANAQNEEDPAEALRNTMIALLEKASNILSEELPPDHEERVESNPVPKVIEAAPKPKAIEPIPGPKAIEPIPEPHLVKEPDPVTPPPPQIPAEPSVAPITKSPPSKGEIKVTKKATKKEEFLKGWMILLAAGLLLIVAFFYALSWDNRKKVKSTGPTLYR